MSDLYYITYADKDEYTDHFEGDDYEEALALLYDSDDYEVLAHGAFAMPVPMDLDFFKEATGL